MHDLILSVVLGIVEGVTESLPVSSTAHLRIGQDLLGLDLSDPFWKMYAVVIQPGAVLCLPVYFWPGLKGYGRVPAREMRGEKAPARRTGTAGINGLHTGLAKEIATSSRTRFRW